MYPHGYVIYIWKGIQTPLYNQLFRYKSIDINIFNPIPNKQTIYKNDIDISKFKFLGII